MKKRKYMFNNTIYACTSVIYKRSEGKCPGMSVIACSSSGIMSAWLAEVLVCDETVINHGNTVNG